MKNIELSALGIRLVGILGLVVTVRVLIQSVETVSWAVMGAYGNPVPAYTIATVCVLVPLFVSVILMKFPLTVARKILPVSSEGVEIRCGAQELQWVCFSVLGVYLFVSTSPQVLGSLFTLWQVWGEPGQDMSLYLFGVFISLFEFSLGLILILQAHGLTKLLGWLRGR